MLSYEHLASTAEIAAVAAGIGRVVAPAPFLLAAWAWELISIVLLTVTLVILNVVESRTLPRTLRRHSGTT